MATMALSSSASLVNAQSNLPDLDPNVSRSEPSTPSEVSPITLDGDTRFSCQYSQGQYTVMYQPQSRPEEAFPWAVPQNLGGGWDAERRCVEISRRLEEYRPDGLLELQNSTENGYNIVCATTQGHGSCRIVFTVPPGQDPLLTRDLVFENITLADGGTMTQGVNTFVGQSSSIRSGSLAEELVNIGMSIVGGQRASAPSMTPRSRSRALSLRPFLDPSDGGTGEGLTRGVRIRRGR
ncbi:hypothetical protein GS597_15820 [Synechococcales cyanobacterium C]|uniref:Circadian oscillating protein COP23 n=1 Tax=Petrachloros mirabilis ULC683 TaxID=2781853 RepID=A0A8K2A190_9CYAN|nr:COP23 domain-containing protein [Petrachloros mirabilis]NCJ07947.1 hypothetical protein [Petrachloros mirabilis ULC683]